MKATARIAQTPSARTGFFATLRAFLGGEGSGAPAHRAIGTLAALLCATAATLALAAPASAAFTHPFRTTLDPAATPTGSFSERLCGVDVDPATQDVYVADPGNGNIDVYNAAGDYQSTVSGAGTEGDFTERDACTSAVDDVNGHLYVGTGYVQTPVPGEAIDVFGPAGFIERWEVGESSSEVSVAIDNSGGVANGRIYVATYLANKVSVFNPSHDPVNFTASASYISGNTLTGTPGKPFNLVSNVAVGPSGELFVVDRFNNRVAEFESSGEFVREFTDAEVPGGFNLTAPRSSIAVDPTDGNLLIGDRGHSVVDEFSPSGTYLGQTTGAGAGPFVSLRAITVNSAGDLYVAEGGRSEETGKQGVNAVYAFGAAHVLPDPGTGEATQIANATATLNGTVNPRETAASYRFEYGPTTAYGHKAPPAAAPVGSDNTSHPESAEVEGLQPSTTYHFRIDAITECEAGRECVNYGADQTFHTHGAPAIDGLPTSTVIGATAKVEAQINPSGYDTKTKVIFGTEANVYPSESPEVDIGAGNSDQPANVQVAGLIAETTYHYRVIATNHCNPSEPAEVCTLESSQDQSFTTAEALSIDSTSVSDVTTSAATLTAQIDPLNLPTTYHFEYLTEQQYKADGESFTGATVIPAPDANVPASPLGSVVASVKAGEARVFVHTNVVSGAFPVGETITGPGIPPGTLIVGFFGETNEYLLSATATATVNEATFTVSAPVSQSISGLGPETAYVYRVLATNSAAPAGIAGPTRVFHTHPTGLDGALPDNRAYELVSPAAKDTGGGVGAAGSIQEATADGSAIAYPGQDFFQSPDGEPIDTYTSFHGPAGWSTRNTTGQSREEAFAPLAPPALPPTPVLPAAVTPAARVLEQTPDGSVVFFTDAGKLTPDSTAAPGEPDLYRYEVAGEQITDLSVDSNSGQHADVQGVLGAGGEGLEAGSYVYFVANGVLAPGASPGNCSPEGATTAPGGECNLYLSHAGATTFIAGLSFLDNGKGVSPSFFQEAHDWTPNRAGRTAEVSPDGRYLAFGAAEHALAPQLGAFLGPQEFRYDAASNSLLCASCNPDGSTSGALYFPQGANAQPKRYLTDDGRLFFNDFGALSPRDVNARADVYEFEDAGTATCQTPGGCRSLISGGGGTGDSLLAAVTGEGSDVFFTATQRLSSEDRDESLDMYDARVNGRPPPAAEIPCETGEACHEKPAPPPLKHTSGSATFHGPPNPVEKTCKKGFVKKGAKCVKKSSKHHGHRKHHKRAANTNRRAGK